MFFYSYYNIFGDLDLREEDPDFGDFVGLNDLDDQSFFIYVGF